MKKIFSTLCGALCALSAENLASSAQFLPLKEFGPARPITPQNATKYGVDNQFDNSVRDYFSVADAVDNGTKPWHTNSLIYGGSYYNSLLFRLRQANFYTILNLTHTNANSYKDGSGKKVPFDYQRATQSGCLTSGWKIA